MKLGLGLGLGLGSGSGLGPGPGLKLGPGQGPVVVRSGCDLRCALRLHRLVRLLGCTPLANNRRRLLTLLVRARGRVRVEDRVEVRFVGLGLAPGLVALLLLQPGSRLRAIPGLRGLG